MSRNQRINSNQKSILVDFMAEHLDLAQGKLLGVEGRRKAELNICVLIEQNVHRYHYLLLIIGGIRLYYYISMKQSALQSLFISVLQLIHRRRFA